MNTSGEAADQNGRDNKRTGIHTKSITMLYWAL